jgi:Homeodomain-like domain
VAMAGIVCPLVSAEDRARLATIVGDCNRPQKHVARARIVLLSADRLDVVAIAREAGISRPAVWRWQRRYASLVAQRTSDLSCTSPFPLFLVFLFVVDFGAPRKKVRRYAVSQPTISRAADRLVEPDWTAGVARRR